MNQQDLLDTFKEKFKISYENTKNEVTNEILSNISLKENNLFKKKLERKFFYEEDDCSRESLNNISHDNTINTSE